MPMPSSETSLAVTLGRAMIAALFMAGAVQKIVSPEDAMALLGARGLPGWLVWPAMIFNAVAGLALLAGIATRWVALALALYCMATSVFHFQPADGWQMSIFVKNWAIAGGLLILMDHARRA